MATGEASASPNLLPKLNQSTAGVIWRFHELIKPAQPHDDVTHDFVQPARSLAQTLSNGSTPHSGEAPHLILDQERLFGTARFHNKLVQSNTQFSTR